MYYIIEIYLTHGSESDKNTILPYKTLLAGHYILILFASKCKTFFRNTEMNKYKKCI